MEHGYGYSVLLHYSHTQTYRMCIETLVKGADKMMHNFLLMCNQREINMVRNAVRQSNAPLIRKFFVAINCLGNGWLYPLTAIAIIAWHGSSSWLTLLVAVVATALTHSIYPPLKRHLARQRPCDYDSSLNLSIKVMDQYSFPSGHVMTATSVGIPIAISFPELTPAVLTVATLIGWARLSLGHHYPSDLIAGAVLGALVSLPLGIAFI